MKKKLPFLSSNKFNSGLKIFHVLIIPMLNIKFNVGKIDFKPPMITLGKFLYVKDFPIPPKGATNFTISLFKRINSSNKFSIYLHNYHEFAFTDYTIYVKVLAFLVTNIKGNEVRRLQKFGSFDFFFHFLLFF